MKILYAGHTYTIHANQAKIAALANTPCADGSVEITLVTPHSWRGPLYMNKAHHFDHNIAPNVDHKVIHALGAGKEGAFVYSPDLVSLIARSKPDIVHVEQGAYALSYTQILMALKVFSPQSRAVFFTWWNLPYKPGGLRRISERFNLAHSTAAIVGNEAAGEILRSHGFQRKIVILPQLGIDLYKDQSYTRAVRESFTPFTIGYAGRISEEKGVLDLVQAIGRMREYKTVLLYIVGSGAALPTVKKTASELGVPLFHHDAVRNEALPGHLAKMDVLVLPSRSTPTWVEQFGHILLEAMAMGIPVIGSSSGEIPNVISNAGLIFEEGNILQLTERLEQLYTNEQERKILSLAGKTRVAECFTHARIAASQMRLYEWMMAHGAPVGRKLVPR